MHIIETTIKSHMLMLLKGLRVPTYPKPRPPLKVPASATRAEKKKIKKLFRKKKAEDVQKIKDIQEIKALHSR
jgi:hypothetical protein